MTLRTHRGWYPQWILPILVCFGIGVPESHATEFMRGMTVSCPRYGQIWGTQAMTKALAKIQTLGVNWVAIHPYARIDKDGRISAQAPEKTGYLGPAIKRVRTADASLFWKPHLAYWGSFSWRGAIEFGNNEKAWARFFDDYQKFIVAHARFAQTHRIPLLAVGTELDQTVHRRTEWRAIIKAVRTVYQGQLTYAANWDRVDNVPFWNQMDLIGVQAYFPLSTQPDPSFQDLRRGWVPHVKRLQKLSKAHGQKKILFTEIGYARSPGAAQKPWAPGMSNDPSAIKLRGRLMQIALEVMDQTPVIAGAFWWKWIPGDNRYDQDFSMKDPHPKEVLKTHWVR